VAEGRMRPGHWLGLVLCVSVIALILIFGWQEGHPAIEIYNLWSELGLLWAVSRSVASL